MKIRAVEPNNRRKTLEVVTDQGTYEIPYAKLRLQPQSADRIVEIAPDPELGNEAFTYRLESGAEDTIHVDAVLEFNRDPRIMHEILLHRLTVYAVDALAESGLTKRALIRRLGTSATQLYRLLDTTNYNKSVDQMLKLIAVLGKDVEVVVR